MDPVIGAKLAGWTYDKRGVSFGTFEDMVANLERTLSRQPYLTGDAFTAADLLLAGGLNVAVNMFKSVPPLPPLTAFLQRTLSRPAAQRAMVRGAAPA